MSNRSISLTDSLHRYMNDVSLRESPLLLAPREETAGLRSGPCRSHRSMQIAPEQGQFMALLVRLIEARQCLEVGVFTGYSSLATALALLAAGRGDTFDFAFIDADKTGYLSCYERTLQLLRAGGVVLIDNTLWSGRVADPAVVDADTVALRQFNGFLQRDERVDLCLLPVGDGLTLARKR